MPLGSVLEVLDSMAIHKLRMPLATGRPLTMLRPTSRDLLATFSPRCLGQLELWHVALYKQSVSTWRCETADAAATILVNIRKGIPSCC